MKYGMRQSCLAALAVIEHTARTQVPPPLLPQRVPAATASDASVQLCQYKLQDCKTMFAHSALSSDTQTCLPEGQHVILHKEVLYAKAECPLMPQVGLKSSMSYLDSAMVNIASPIKTNLLYVLL